MRQSCPGLSLTITKRNSTAQFCAFPLPHPFPERNQEIEIQVSVFTQGMYIAPVIKKNTLVSFWDELQGQHYTKKILHSPGYVSVVPTKALSSS